MEVLCCNETLGGHILPHFDLQPPGCPVQQAGAEFERAAESFEPVVQRHEMTVAAKRMYEEQQHEKELTEARSWQRSYDGPTLG